MHGVRSSSKRWPLPLRARLTLVFAAAAAVVLAGVGLIVYLEFSAEVTRSADAGLLKSEAALETLAAEGDTPAELRAESGERLLQVYARDGRLLASSRALTGTSLLTPAAVRRVASGAPVVERRSLPGGDAARIRAFGLGSGKPIAAIGASLKQSDDLRRRLLLVLALSLPGALLLSSYLGYRVTGSALSSVERMRIQAERITDPQEGERLPLPGTRDEIDRLGLTFNALLDRLAESVQRERRIVSDASHELRTPLSVMRAELEVAARRDRTDQQVRDAVASSLEETRRLSRLAEDLLVLARADQGRLPLRAEPLDVGDLLDATAMRNRAAATEAGRELRTLVDISGGAVVLGDPDRVAQALDNMVANALRHGDGTVEVRAALAESHRVALSVSDEGPGIPDALLPHLFERFSQGDPAHSGPGSGLGLAIVDAIAHAHGGVCHAANGERGGAVVSIEIPLA